MTERWIVEGEWSGYTSAQRRVVHRDIVSKKTAEAIRKLGAIRYTDGTVLNLSVRQCKPRERVELKQSYSELISKCLARGVASVAALNGIPE